MGVLDCGTGMFYDPPTKTCTHCSIICDDMDIQDTRVQCLNKCPDYYTSTSIVTTTTTTVTTTLSSSSSTITTDVGNDATIAICVLLAVLLMIVVVFILLHYKKTLVNLIKKRDCCGEDEQAQVHAQETRQDSERPENYSLLPDGNVAFADMPHSR